MHGGTNEGQALEDHLLEQKRISNSFSNGFYIDLMLGVRTAI
jgi:hypothetical protein